MSRRRTTAAIEALLSTNDYEAVLTYDPVAGLRASAPQTAGEALRDLAGDGSWTDPAGQTLAPEQLAQLVRVIQPMATPRRRLGLVVDYLSQLAPAAEALSPAYRALFLSALQRVQTTQRASVPSLERAPLFNPVLWLVDRPGDLPGWMVSGGDGIHQVPIPQPSLDARAQAARHSGCATATSVSSPRSIGWGRRAPRPDVSASAWADLRGRPPSTPTPTGSFPTAPSGSWSAPTASPTAFH